MSGTYPLAPTMINLLYRGIHQGGKCTPFSSQYRARCLLPHLAGYGFCLWNRLLYETSPWFIIRI